MQVVNLIAIYDLSAFGGSILISLMTNIMGRVTDWSRIRRKIKNSENGKKIPPGLQCKAIASTARIGQTQAIESAHERAVGQFALGIGLPLGPAPLVG